MKRFMNFLLVCLIALVTFVTTSCEKLGLKTQEKTTVQPVVVEDVQICPFDPEFTTTEQVMEFRQQLAEDYRLDSVMLSMDEGTLLNVASVCEKRFNKFRRRQIVDEYLKNISIYKNLPNHNTPTVTEGPRVTPDPPEQTVSIEFTDTIIGGKKYRIEKRVIKDGN